MLSFAIVAAVLSMTLFQSALTAACNYDGQCHSGEFCDTTLSECTDCLKCEDLKREPPSAATSCIKTVSECGACLKGLVEDRYDEFKCIPPKEGDDASSGGSTTMWVVIGVFVVLLIIIAAAFFAHLWRTRKTKSHSINNDTILPVISASYPQAPTAPESPPPYRPISDIYQPGEASESDHPLIRIQPAPPQYLVSDDPQKANVYNPPAYVRYGHQHEPPEEVNDVNDNYVEQDEATTESLWTPGPSSNGATAVENSSSEPVIEQPAASASSQNKLATALAAARNTELIQPPAKRTKTMDQNENVNGEEELHESTHDGASRSAQQFNIVIQVNQKLV